MAEAANVVQATLCHILKSTVTLEILELLRLNKDMFLSLTSILRHRENNTDVSELETTVQKRLDQLSFFKKTLTKLEYFLGIASVLPDNTGAPFLSSFLLCFYVIVKSISQFWAWDFSDANCKVAVAVLFFKSVRNIMYIAFAAATSVAI